MSTILKALRRLEQEKSTRSDRPLGEAVASAAPVPAPQAVASRRWPMFAGIAIGVIVLGVAACFLPRRRNPALITFLLGGWFLWFTFFIGRDAWGSLLYLLPLLKSYQWGRFETLLQFWGACIAAATLRVGRRLRN